MQDLVLDDLDLQLLNALQIQPRASWSALGAVLGTDPVTLARRWERIRRAGIAWVTGYAMVPGVLAIVEIEARASRLLDLARSLASDPEAMTVDLTSGARDVVVTVVAPTEQDLFGYLLGRLEGLDSVDRVHSHPVAQVVTDASAWRLRALDAHQVRSLQSSEPTGRRHRRPNDVDVLVAAELTRDGRVAPASIADRHGLNVRRVRESIAELIGSGRMRLRTEIVRSVSGWPVSAWYFLSVPAAQIESVGSQLSRIEEIRTVISVVGRYNIAMAVWMRTLSDVSRLEAAIERQLPDVRIADRSVVMRTTKLVGNLLDDSGRAVGYVPLATAEAWSPTS